MIMSKEKKLARVMSDPRLFFLNMIKIVDNDGNLVPFKLNEQQQYFLDNMDRFNCILKSRQIGFTTYSLAYCLWQALTRPNSNYLIVSHKGELSLSLFEKLKSMYRNLPHDRYEFAKEKRNNRNELLFENGSRIQCSMEGLKTVGIGNTYQYILLSEFAMYKEQEKMLLAVEQALAKNADSKIVIETTPNGMSYFAEMFTQAMKGKSRYKAFFFPWYSSAMKKQFAFEYELASDWFKANNKGRKLYGEDLDPDEKTLHEKGATLLQLTWRRWKLLSTDLKDFWTHYPSTPFEAFVTSGENVFDQLKVVEALDHAMPPLNYQDVAGSLPESLHKYVGKGLRVYHLPKRGKRYWGGVDTASGGGGSTDDSAICILDEDARQVCAFNSNSVPVHVFSQVVNDLGRWYGYTFLCVERNSFGLPLLERLRKDYQYMNLYKHKTFDQHGKRKNQLGWLTTNVSKSLMVCDYKEQFETGMIYISDIETLEQMRIFVDKDGKLGNKRGDNLKDDLCVASMLSVQAIKSRKYYI